MITTELDSVAPPAVKSTATGDFVSIRGVRLDLATLVHEDMLSPENIEVLKQRFFEAKPFPHLVIEGLFNPALLELIHEEFDMLDPQQWRQLKDAQHNFGRVRDGTRYGPASRLYFSLVNSGPFVSTLSAITGIDTLVDDPYLYGGGLHETKAGGKFDMHADFNKHPRSMLDHEVIMLTYLNKDWQASYQGALELWDIDTRECVQSVLPTFGRTILMRHSPRSLHGHPHPLAPPPGRTRRSIATSYYTNRNPNDYASKRLPSQFLLPDHISLTDRLKKGIWQVTPPIVWLSMRSLVKGKRDKY